ncbi:hypothetical protein ABZ897_20180 [Nonomuraea sp. NPDC046802]|uniref:hypothetical protein n=1 Tax=Nonomuraea sp. NPDC046802 TaxID=3154919 RepID=UPI0033C30147
MSGKHAAGTPDGFGVHREWGYLEARHDKFGPFVEIRWRQKRIVVREMPWLQFLDRVRTGEYRAADVSGRADRVSFEIDEGFAEHERPVAWTPKAMEVPGIVWERFVDAVGRGCFANLGYVVWTGAPSQEPPDVRSPAPRGEVPGDASEDNPG